MTETADIAAHFTPAGFFRRAAERLEHVPPAATTDGAGDHVLNPDFGVGDIASELAPSDPNDRQLVLTTFFAGLSVGQLVYGPVSDAIGRKRALYSGLALFILGGVIGAATGERDFHHPAAEGHGTEGGGEGGTTGDHPAEPAPTTHEGGMAPAEGAVR